MGRGNAEGVGGGLAGRGEEGEALLGVSFGADCTAPGITGAVRPKRLVVVRGK